MTKGGLAWDERASGVWSVGAIASCFLWLRPEAATDVRQRAELERSEGGRFEEPLTSVAVGGWVSLMNGQASALCHPPQADLQRRHSAWLLP
ncbi:hypothetical protein D6783_02445 [Candidatus Woesearchaeota archaeon]|nr:MAG: hypothetical protein D6783_02445 [Candidatus Woesearchaeota archaeon]